MVRRVEVKLFEVNDHTWITERNFGVNSYTIEKREERFYIWCDSLSGRHLVGVLPTMALAKTELEIVIGKKGDKGK